jgi:hypothetical protein
MRSSLEADISMRLSRREFVDAAISADTVNSVPIRRFLSSPWGGPASPSLIGKMRACFFSISPTPGRHLDLRRRWSSGDTITVKFRMTSQGIEANPRVVEAHDRVAAHNAWVNRAATPMLFGRRSSRRRMPE